MEASLFPGWALRFHVGITQQGLEPVHAAPGASPTLMTSTFLGDREGGRAQRSAGWSGNHCDDRPCFEASDPGTWTPCLPEGNPGLRCWNELTRLWLTQASAGKPGAGNRGRWDCLAAVRATESVFSGSHTGPLRSDPADVGRPELARSALPPGFRPKGTRVGCALQC